MWFRKLIILVNGGQSLKHQNSSQLQIVHLCVNHVEPDKSIQEIAKALTGTLISVKVLFNLQYPVA